MSADMLSGNTIATPRVTAETNDMLPLKDRLIIGLQSGIIAAYTMGLTAMVVVWIHSWGTWTPFNDVAGAFIAYSANAGTNFNIVSVIVATIIHFSVSIGLGILFTLFYSMLFRSSLDTGMAMIFGLLFGLLTWLLARLMIFPLTGSEIYGTLPFLVAHMVFGATLGAVYPFATAARRLGQPH